MSFSVFSGTSAVKQVSCIRILPVCCKSATQRLLSWSLSVSRRQEVFHEVCCIYTLLHFPSILGKKQRISCTSMMVFANLFASLSAVEDKSADLQLASTCRYLNARWTFCPLKLLFCEFIYFFWFSRNVNEKGQRGKPGKRKAQWEQSGPFPKVSKTARQPTMSFWLLFRLRFVKWAFKIIQWWST